MTRHQASARASDVTNSDRYRELVGTVNAIVSEYDVREERFTYVSDQVERILGYAPELLQNDVRVWLSNIDEEDRDLVEAATTKALQDRSDHTYDYRIRAADGRLVWLRVSASVVPDEEGESAFVRAVWVDVTELKQAELERERSLSLLRATLDATADAILVVGLDGRNTAYNPPFAELWPIPQAVLDTGDDAAALESVLVRLVDPEEFSRRVAEIYADPESESYDVFELVDGRTIERDSAPQRLGDEIVGRVWCFRDITETRAAQRALRLSEQRHRETLENVALVAASIDARGVVTFANDALLELTGWSREEVVGRNWFELFDDNPYVRADYFERMELGEIRPHFESTIRTRSGERREIYWSSTLVHDESGTVAGITTIGEDVTERRRADAILPAAGRSSSAR